MRGAQLPNHPEERSVVGRPEPSRRASVTGPVCNRERDMQPAETALLVPIVLNHSQAIPTVDQKHIQSHSFECQTVHVAVMQSPCKQQMLASR